LQRITLDANNIDGAAEQIIHLLEDADKGGDVIYFHGWAGWGASAVLKEVVKLLRSSLGSADAGTAGGLEKIIHVDFSRWQSKRALQKAIAEELEPPQQVMAFSRSKGYHEALQPFSRNCLSSLQDGSVYYPTSTPSDHTTLIKVLEMYMHP
jgi:hypothetical protein